MLYSSFETYKVQSKQKIYLLQIFIKVSTTEMETRQQDSVVVAVIPNLLQVLVLPYYYWI